MHENCRHVNFQFYITKYNVQLFSKVKSYEISNSGRVSDKIDGDVDNDKGRDCPHDFDDGDGNHKKSRVN